MLRPLIALLITCFAIAFAFAAMAAVRWPTLMMAANALTTSDSMGTLTGISWRELGVVYGLPYFLAALCFYAAAMKVAVRRGGAVAWYLMACVAGFPSAYLVDFEPGWWRDPSAAEGAVAGAGLAALMLLAAVWELRRRPPPRQAPLLLTQPLRPEAPEPALAPAPKRPEWRPVPPAIARQRAHFRTMGRRIKSPSSRPRRD